MRHRGFEGWYFKHQKGHKTLAFIPSRGQDGAFVQMISPQGARQFRVSGLVADGDLIRAGKCRFSPAGCTIDLPGVRGSIAYGEPLPLCSDIMGPFRRLPMQCRHGVISMGHPLHGCIAIDGIPWNFDGGIGYTETDSGISFPSSYLWVQCNAFPEPAGIIAAIADIPFCGLSFRGCICAIVHGGVEYRFATYLGVRVLAAEPDHIRLSQGGYLLDICMAPSPKIHPLAAPQHGRMSGIIRECCNAHIRMRLWKKSAQIFDLSSAAAAYEYTPAGTFDR